MMRDKTQNFDWILDSSLINNRVKLHNLRLTKKINNNILDKIIISELTYITKFILLVFSSFLEIFRYSKSENLLKKHSLVYDLTRQHLPPHIEPRELYEFFFQPDRRMISENSRNIFIMKKTPFGGNDDYKSLFFTKSFNRYVISGESNFFGKLRLVNSATIQTIFFIIISIKTNHLNYILSDIFEIALFESSTTCKSLNEIILTNNSFFSYPSISFIPKNKRHFHIVMLHYSENAFDWTKKSSQQELSWISYAKADLHKVWTPEYAQFLTDSNIHGEVEFCGSIIFRPKIDYCASGNNVIRIAVFDIAPSIFEEQFSPYGLLCGMSFLNCIKSFYNIAGKIYGEKLEFVFKAKRRDIPGSYNEYLSLRDELFNLKGFHGAKWSDNLYKIIASSNFVICMVGSSPALIAKELKIPVVYLHVGDVVIFDPPVNNGVKVLYSLDELLINFQSIFK